MRIVESNRLAVLADDLLQHWPQQPGPDLETTSIVVPSLGMARWLTYRIATAFSVCAQVEFVYPATYVWSLFARVVPALATRSPFDANTLSWRIYRLLSAGSVQPATALSRYLQSADARDRLGLARRVASVYAEILAQRPSWAPQWQRNQLNAAEPLEHEVWLAALWRQLASEIPAAAGAHPRDEVFKRLKRDPAARAALPASITVFAVPQMAALYQSVLQDFARYVDVTVYLVNPSPEFWFDQESRAQQARRRDTRQAAFDFGGRPQRLLSALGRQARENLAAWGVGDADRQDSATRLEELFIEPAGSSLLARLQREVFAGVASDGPEPLDGADKSIQIHVCHSLARQLEVLHDQLLDVFDGNQSGAAYAPGEILVLVPDLDQAAATIDAVFGSALGGVNIPYVISGRAANQDSPLIGAFFALLALPSGRYPVSAIAELLELPAMALRFQIDALALQRILAWLKDTGVHWGMDLSTRQHLHLPEESKHTFAEGLAALFMGYASAAAQPLVIEGVMPYQDLEGKDAQALGALARFMASVAALEERLTAPRSPHQWIASFAALLDDFFVRRADPLFELSRLDRALASLGETVDVTAFEEAVALNVMVDALRHALSDNAPGAVPTGSVTFCAFGPLRQLPYRMICMLDLNGDGRFPRNPQRPEFDLLARQHRSGDRNLIDEDRGAFLDAVCAAGERLQCYYNGRSMRDNAPLPPSSTLDDLIDTLAGLVGGGDDALRTQVMVEHPLQPFSRRYFETAAGGPDLFSYARELVFAASGARTARPAFFTAALSPPDAGYRDIEWHMLARVLSDPVSALLKERLGLETRDNDGVLEDDEPEQLSPLDMKRLRERLFALHQAGASNPQLSHVALAFPEAPPGVLGEIAMTPQIEATLKFASIVADLRPAQLSSSSFVLQRGEFQLLGTLDGLHSGGRFDAHLGSLKSRELLRCWLAHLIMHLLPDHFSGHAPESRLICADKIALFTPVENAAALLDDLLAVYWDCLARPVALIPDLSFDFAVGKADAAARKRARNKWYPSSRGKSFVRAAQRQYRTAYGETLTDLPADFEAVSLRVFAPLCQHLTITPADEVVVLETADTLEAARDDNDE